MAASMACIMWPNLAGTELGFNTDETYLASIIGKTVTQITYYTADGVYVLPVNVAL
ncbi:hypothetical protein LEA_05907 [human gut metagenome]|uniref:Uncharacterized protein n=1 Tax=human gut metagenome TaxID=408170 RepID=K1U2F7_9ZZZZ